MLKLSGTVVSVNVTETPKQKLKITEVQLLSNGGKYHNLVSLTDFDNREWPKGKQIEIPVWVKAYVSKNGRAGINYQIAKEI